MQPESVHTGRWAAGGAHSGSTGYYMLPKILGTRGISDFYFYFLDLEIFM